MAQALCENALVMAPRVLVGSGPVDELIRRPRHAPTKALVDAVFAAKLPSEASGLPSEKS